MNHSLACRTLCVHPLKYTNCQSESSYNLRQCQWSLSGRWLLRKFSLIAKTSEKYGHTYEPIFKPRTAAILSRITRYEFEKLRYKGLGEKDFRLKLERKRSDYDTLKERHETHYRSVKLIQQSLVKRGIETKVQVRPTFTSETIDWADVIFTAGGDGTYLDAASKVHTDKPVIGINTDPTRSEGSLCLERSLYSATDFEAVITRLLAEDFKWKWRQRIRITISGHHCDDNPIELHDQQLEFLEHRYTEHVHEHMMSHRPPRNMNFNATEEVRVLPIRALNEVFIGECLSSRVSYYKLSVDDGPDKRQKSSGVTICTGTGSSSWYFHINHITSDAVTDILNIAQNEIGGPVYQSHDATFITRVTKSFNDSLKFDPSEPYMAFAVRDPLKNAVFQVPQPRGLAKKIQICSRMWDATLVVDGGSSFKFNDGAIATMEIFDEDALRTVEF